MKEQLNSNDSVLLWDPDFTKVTSEEAKHIRDAEKSGFVDESDIDWDNLNSVLN